MTDFKSLLRIDPLIAWLETMPADESYEYIDSSQCLLARYLQAKGVFDETDSIGPWSFVYHGEIFTVPSIMNDIASGAGYFSDHPDYNTETCGAALRRARYAKEMGLDKEDVDD